jgi:arylsulfatase A-like enzyme
MGNHTADSIVSGRYLDGLYGPLAINGHAPPVAFMSNPLLWKSGLLSSLEKERWVGDVALAFVKDATPQFLMVNIAGPDVAGHETGGIISPAAMIQSVKNADIQVGRIRAAYGQLGILDKTLFVVVADHGMIPNTHVIDSELVRTAAEANSTVIAVSAGNHLWLRHPAKAEAVAQAIVQGLGSRLLAVYYKVNTSGIYEYLPAKPASQPDAYAYLLDTYACANGPDVVMMAPENSVLGNVAEIANSKGSHTAITWDTQHVPLIIAGPGVRKGWVSSFPARLVDIAPTILAIAGIQPEGMDGVVLADSMVTPSPGAVNAMQTIEGRLRSAQEALISLSSGP